MWFSMMWFLGIGVLLSTLPSSLALLPLPCFPLHYYNTVVLQQRSQVHHSAIEVYHGIVGVGIDIVLFRLSA